MGRADNVINSGGVKLFPEQIEKKLKPFIETEFIISSLPDETLGQKLILILEGQKNDYSELLEMLPSSTLDKFEKPKAIYFLDKFPRTESGKLKREKIKGLIISI